MLRSARLQALVPEFAVEIWGELRTNQEETVTTDEWGYAPVLTLVGAIGLLIVSFAFSAARYEEPWAQWLFWAGMAVLFLPVFGRLLSARPSRRERIGLVAMLGMGLYIVKVLHSPLMFTNHDEFLHWRTTNDILRTGELFHQNPMLPASPLHPGLESVTTAFTQLSGLDFFVTGTIVVGLARLLLVLSLYLTFEAVSGSPRVAGVAAALYMTHPNFLLFNGMYKYESLALAFAGLAVYAIVRRQDSGVRTGRGFSVVTIFAISAVVVTHHLSAYALIGLLGLWTVCTVLLRKNPANRPGPVAFLVFGVVLGAAWLFFVANIVIGYIAPHLTAAVSELVGMIRREAGAGRPLFQSSGSGEGSGIETPIWERLTALSAVGLLMIAIVFGLWWVWRHHRRRAIALALAVATLGYPGALALRFTGSGWEIGNRTSEFVFVAVGLIAAFGLVRIGLVRNAGFVRTAAVALCGLVILFGGVISGWPPAWRLPGPYVVGHAGTASIEAQGVAAATWASTYLGPDNRMAADNTNHLLMGSIGEQFVQSSLSGGIDPKWFLFAPRFDRNLRENLERQEIRFFVVDWRLTATPRIAGRYYPGTTVEEAFLKFEHLPEARRVFDDGDVLIYEVTSWNRPLPADPAARFFQP